MSDADTTIDELARQQFGVAHRRQLHDRGVTPRQVKGRIDSGRLIELGNSVLAVRGHPATLLRQYKAAELAIVGAAIAGPAALHLNALEDRTSSAEIVVPPGGNHRCSFARVHRRTDVAITTVRGIRVTTVPQTLVDVTGRLPIERLEAAWTTALIRGMTTLDELAERVAAAEEQRLRHRGLARAVLDSLVEGDALAESELEVLLLGIARSIPGIPEVVPQMRLEWWRGGRGRADAGVPDWKLILEADGRSWHARLADFDRDRERDNLAVANGYAVQRFSALHLRTDPGGVADLIAQAGRARRAA
jgi:hypothetical protein